MTDVVAIVAVLCLLVSVSALRTAVSRPRVGVLPFQSSKSGNHDRGVYRHLSTKLASAVISDEEKEEKNEAARMQVLELPADITSGGWLPIGDVHALSGSKEIPVAMKVAGLDLVVWQNPLTSEFSVMHDVCPHRSAPLSQGRVDEFGCIECPYHGWAFETDGACSNIPQMEKSKNPMNNKMTHAKTVPTMLAGDMLFAFVPFAGDSGYFPESPLEAYPGLDDLEGWTTRDLPYSFDFLVENFMDPGHIPFAHHSLQGVRSDGSPIEMKALTDITNSTHLELKFKDKIRAKERTGIVSFRAPCYYHFRVPDNWRPAQWNKILTILCVPVSPGKCRVHLSLSFPPDKDGNRRNPIPSWVPLWLIHGRSNNFLDSDVWVHDQERAVRQRDEMGTNKGAPSAEGYVLPTSSDMGAAAWRRWWRRHMAGSPLFGASEADQLPALTIDQKLDRWSSHTENCQHCRSALESSIKWDRGSKIAVVALFALFKGRLPRVLGAAAFLTIQAVCGFIRRSTLGAPRGERTSAAQFPVSEKQRETSFVSR